MSDASDDTPRIIIDDDWKNEAAREKEMLAEEAEPAGLEEELPSASFPELLNMLVMQIIVALGGMQTPDGRMIPPNLDLAKHHIDLLGVLEEKTKGNLSEEEDKMMSGTLYELRMQFVKITGGGRPEMPQDGPPPTQA
jgi:hypothetical protein